MVARSPKAVEPSLFECPSLLEACSCGCGGGTMALRWQKPQHFCLRREGDLDELIERSPLTWTERPLLRYLLRLQLAYEQVYPTMNSLRLRSGHKSPNSARLGLRKLRSRGLVSWTEGERPSGMQGANIYEPNAKKLFALVLQTPVPVPWWRQPIRPAGTQPSQPSAHAPKAARSKKTALPTVLREAATEAPTAASEALPVDGALVALQLQAAHEAAAFEALRTCSQAPAAPLTASAPASAASQPHAADDTSAANDSLAALEAEASEALVAEVPEALVAEARMAEADEAPEALAALVAEAPEACEASEAEASEACEASEALEAEALEAEAHEASAANEAVGVDDAAEAIETASNDDEGSADAGAEAPSSEIGPSLVQACWQERYQRRYGSFYPITASSADRSTLAELALVCSEVLAAHRALAPAGASDHELAIAYLTHVFDGYLARPGRHGVLVEKRHPLAWIKHDLGTLGVPWKPPSPVRLVARAEPSLPPDRAPIVVDAARAQALAKGARGVLDSLQRQQPAPRPSVRKRDDDDPK